MSISRHPSDETLAAFAAGTLDEGSAFVVGAHLAMCRACRSAAREFECVGGVLLEQAGDAAILPGSARAASNIALAQTEARLPRAAASPDALERLLSLYGHGPWKWIGLGVHSARVDLPPGSETRAFLLRAAPGTNMPRHSHTGLEWTLVLKGAYVHEFGRYGAGDFDEADDEIDHQPVVEKGAECVCLVAMTGELRLQGMLGKLLQPFVRV